MAKNQTRRIASGVLSDDREAFDALQGITAYAPANQAYKTETIKAARDHMDDLLRKATQAEATADAKRAAANASEWEFHNAILGAKVQVGAVRRRLGRGGRARPQEEVGIQVPDAP